MASTRALRLTHVCSPRDALIRASTNVTYAERFPMRAVPQPLPRNEWNLMATTCLEGESQPGIPLLPTSSLTSENPRHRHSQSHCCHCSNPESLMPQLFTMTRSFGVPSMALLNSDELARSTPGDVTLGVVQQPVLRLPRLVLVFHHLQCHTFCSATRCILPRTTAAVAGQKKRNGTKKNKNGTK